MHAKYSPSASHRWLKCTGSLLYSDEPQQTSEYAIEGSKAHAICEHLVRGGKPFRLGDTVKAAGGEILYDETLHDAAMMYCDYVWAKEKELDARAIIEGKISVSSNLYGTPDCVISAPFVTLVVIDFKYGEGETVDPFNNPQLMLYALGHLLKSEALPLEVELCIVQPRSRDKDKIKVWKTTPEVIFDFGNEVGNTIAKFESGEHTFEPGKHCHWCRGIRKCPAITEAYDEALSVDGESPIDKLVKILNAEKAILEKINQVKLAAYNALLAGQTVPGYKLVRSIGDRKWADPDKVKKKFGLRKACEYQVLSPAQLEKRLGKEHRDWINKNCTRKDNGLVLAPESDRRAAQVIDIPEIENGTVE